jgi:septal ring factor EnvC (AmiA/AmiB activator)
MDREFERANQEVQHHIAQKTQEVAAVKQEIKKTEDEITALTNELAAKKKLLDTAKQNIPKLREKERKAEKDLEEIHHKQENALRQHTAAMQQAGMKNIKL